MALQKAGPGCMDQATAMHTTPAGHAEADGRAVDPPAATVGDPPELLDADVHHVAGPACVDTARCPVGFTGRVQEPAPVEPNRARCRPTVRTDT